MDTGVESAKLDRICAIAQTCKGMAMVEERIRALGTSVRQRRHVLGLRQQELADLAEVSVRFVHDLEHGKPTVRLAQVVQVLDALGLSLEVRGPKRVGDV